MFNSMFFKSNVNSVTRLFCLIWEHWIPMANLCWITVPGNTHILCQQQLFYFHIYYILFMGKPLIRVVSDFIYNISYVKINARLHSNIIVTITLMQWSSSVHIYFQNRKIFAKKPKQYLSAMAKIIFWVHIIILKKWLIFY